MTSITETHDCLLAQSEQSSLSLILILGIDSEFICYLEPKIRPRQDQHRPNIRSQASHMPEIRIREGRMATVHSYKRWDISRDAYVTTRLKGTPKYIASIRGEIMPNTAEDVEPSCMDGQGRYDPKSLLLPATTGALASRRFAPISQGLYARRGVSRRDRPRTE